MASQYDPRTGITTFRDPAADPNADEAAVVAPSTATSFTAAPSTKGMLPSQPQPSIFDPVNPQVRPRDDFFGFQYNYSPEELAQLGYQYVPESTTSRFVRRNDDRERINETIPGHYIDPTRFAPMRRPGDDSDLPDWMFSQRVRNGDDFDLVRNQLVVDPFRPITPGHLDQLRQYGLWQNLSDPNAPLYAPLRAKGITPTPYQMASMLLGQGGIGLTSTPEEWAAAFDGMEISPELAQGIRERLQDILDNYKENANDPANTAFNIALAAGIAAMTGGAGAPAWLAGAAGAGGSTAIQGGDLDAVLNSAAMGGISGGVGSSLAPALGGGMLGAAGAGALTAGGLAALTGQDDPLKQALLGGAISSAAQGIGEYLHPSTAPDTAFAQSTELADSSPAFDPFKRQGTLPSFFEATGSQVPGAFPDLAAGAPLSGPGQISGSAVSPLMIAQAAGTITDFASPLAQLLEPTASQVPGAALDPGAGAPGTISGEQTGSVVPRQFDGSLNSLLGATGMLPATSSDVDLQPREPSSEPAKKEPTEAEKTARTVERLAKFGRALAQLHEGRGEPEDAPQREEGQSDAEYVQTLGSYLGLDPATVAAQGAPGSAEAIDYILAQADAIIAQLGVDPAFLDGATADELAAALRTRTREQLDALERALYVRGALGTLSTNSRGVDPFTGQLEEFYLAPGQSVQGSRAAFERGRAREIEQLAGLHGREARRYLGGLTERDDVDLFGLQQRADARTLAEQLAMQDIFADPDIRRRRQGGAMSPEFWRGILDEMSPGQLRALLLSFGGDVDRGRAALGQLVG